MRYAPDPQAGVEERLERVVRSFQGLATAMAQVRFPGCRQRLSCNVTESESGAQVRLETEDHAAEAILSVDRSGVTLRAITHVRPGAEVATTIEDQFSIHLDDELRWGDVVFRSPDVLACRLLEHAARRLTLLAGDRPEPPPATPARSWAAGVLTDRVYGWTRGMPSTRTSTPLRPPRMRDG